MGQTYGIEHIEYLFPYDLEEVVPVPPDSSPRFIIVLDEPNVALLPYGTIQGDTVFVKSDNEVYVVDSSTQSSQVKDVVVVNDNAEVASEVVPGDMVFNDTTDVLYRVGA